MDPHITYVPTKEPFVSGQGYVGRSFNGAVTYFQTPVDIIRNKQKENPDEPISFLLFRKETWVIISSPRYTPFIERPMGETKSFLFQAFDAHKNYLELLKKTLLHSFSISVSDYEMYETHSFVKILFDNIVKQAILVTHFANIETTQKDPDFIAKVYASEPRTKGLKLPGNYDQKVAQAKSLLTFGIPKLTHFAIRLLDKLSQDQETQKKIQDDLKKRGFVSLESVSEQTLNVIDDLNHLVKSLIEEDPASYTFITNPVTTKLKDPELDKEWIFPEGCKFVLTPSSWRAVPCPGFIFTIQTIKMLAIGILLNYSIVTTSFKKGILSSLPAIKFLKTVSQESS